MRHLLLSGAALLALVYPANSVTMQIGYMGQDIAGPPEPYTFVVTATSNGNIISDTRMIGTWEVTVMGSTDGVNLYNTLQVQQHDTTKTDWLLISLWALDVHNPGTSYLSQMNLLDPLNANISLVQLANYSTPIGSPFYQNGLSLYSDNGPTQVTAPGSYNFLAGYPVIGDCKAGCSENSVWYIGSRPEIMVTPVPAALPISPVPLPAALPLFATGLGIMGVLGWRSNRKPAAKPA
jgi:hypothetical protein